MKKILFFSLLLLFFNGCDNTLPNKNDDKLENVQTLKLNINNNKELLLKVNEYADNLSSNDTCGNYSIEDIEKHKKDENNNFNYITFKLKKVDCKGNTYLYDRKINIDWGTIPKIELNGNKTINLKIGDQYIEEGATATDNEDGDLTNSIIKTSNLDITKVGKYTITYTVTDSDLNTVSINRNVIIRSNESPIIYLNGEKDIKLKIGDQYIEEGATATDKEDGDLTNSIIKTSNLDITKIGKYTITYTVTDSDNNTYSLIRNIRIMGDTKPEIKLKGNIVEGVLINTNYIEPGVTATDEEDGDLTDKITQTSNLDITKAGTYTITYSVTDSDNNTVSVQRNVVVRENNPPVITLNGPEEITIKVHGTWTDPGYTAIDPEDGDLTQFVYLYGKKAGTYVLGEQPDLDTEGTYYIKYLVEDIDGNQDFKIRKIIVRSDTPPTLELKGETDLRLITNTSYEEPGYTSNDKEDGDLTNKVIINSNLDLTTNGTYTITYKITDSDGNTVIKHRNIEVVDPLLLLNANDGIHGYEPWVTDGTEEGTKLLKDINPNGDSNIKKLYSGTKTLFIANDGIHGNEPWVTDGTEEGTKLLKDINPNGSSDISNFKLYKNKFYFVANDGIHGRELWTSDGTAEKTNMLLDFNTNGNSYMNNLIFINDDLYFSVKNNDSTYSIIKLDMVNNSLINIKNTGINNINKFLNINNKLAFVINNNQLWITNGNNNNETLLLNSSKPITEMISDGHYLYFKSWDENHGFEPWVSDGTIEGTKMLTELNTLENTSSNPFDFVPVNSGIFVVADNNIVSTNSTLRTVIFTTNNGSFTKHYVETGTSETVYSLKKIGNFIFKYSKIHYYNYYNGGLSDQNYLSIYNPNSDKFEILRQTDEDYQNGQLMYHPPLNFNIYEGKIFFWGYNKNFGSELYVSDGTKEGTRLLKDINVGPESSK